MASLPKAVVRLHLLCVFFAIGSFIWGYNVGILSSVLVHPGFIFTLEFPTASQKGVITSIYYLGTWTSYVFLAHPASDYLGRRYAALVGIIIVAVGTAIQCDARPPAAYAMMIIGRIVSGVGVGLVSTSVPLYQSEVAPAGKRGKYVVLNHVGFVAGLAVGFWVGYAVTFWPRTPWNDYFGWRLSLIVIFIPIIIFGIGLPFLPETPRWLTENAYHDRTLKSLYWLREGLYTQDQIHLELLQIQQSTTSHAALNLTYKSLFTTPALFRRLWRASLLQFMAQMCGATAMKYYLPTLLQRLGLSTRIALMAGGIESTLKIVMTIVEMLLIDRLGRRVTLVSGTLAMGIAMLLNGALGQVYPNNTNRTADIVCVVFIFIYALGYSMGFGPAAWVYGSEIFPTALRARGLSLSASGGAIGSIVVAQVWPVGIDAIGSNIYFFFTAINFICIPIILVFYPETKGRALEDMDVLFEHHARGRRDGPIEDADEAGVPKNVQPSTRAQTVAAP